MTTISPLGTGGWGSALRPGHFGASFLVLPPFRSRFLSARTASLPRRGAAAALQPALAPRFRIMSHHGDIDRGARRVLVGVLVLLNPVGAQPFAGPIQVLQRLRRKRYSYPSARRK